MRLNLTCSGVRIDKHLSDAFPIQNGLKRGASISSWLFNFPLECAIRKIQESKDGLELNGTNQVLISAADVNL
jgi:hypothetical protein